MNDPFMPKLVYFEPNALDYPLGKELFDKFTKLNIEIRYTTSHNQVRNLPGENDFQKYRNAKSTLVVGLRKTLKFDTSKPAADNYIEERAPEITRFEAACTSDIVGIDHLTHTLKRAIEHFGQTELGRLRFVTKFHHVDHLLDAKHNGNTRFRFSINADYVIKNFEPGTSPLAKRIEAAGKVARAGYPLGFIVAPIYLHDGWQEGYYHMFERLNDELPLEVRDDITFEFIQHRFTKPAKRVIEKNYPKTKLELDEEKRRYKWGKYGIGKYIYQKDEEEEMKSNLFSYMKEFFPNAKLEYFT